MLQIVELISLRINVYRICIEGINFSQKGNKKSLVKVMDLLGLLQHESGLYDFY
jgi:hypothetical protein